MLRVLRFRVLRYSTIFVVYFLYHCKSPTFGMDGSLTRSLEVPWRELFTRSESYCQILVLDYARGSDSLSCICANTAVCDYETLTTGKVERRILEGFETWKICLEWNGFIRWQINGFWKRLKKENLVKETRLVSEALDYVPRTVELGDGGGVSCKTCRGGKY